MAQGGLQGALLISGRLAASVPRLAVHRDRAFIVNLNRKSLEKGGLLVSFREEVCKVAKDEKIFLLISVMAFYTVLGYDKLNYR